MCVHFSALFIPPLRVCFSSCKQSKERSGMAGLDHTNVPLWDWTDDALCLHRSSDGEIVFLGRARLCNFQHEILRVHVRARTWRAALIVSLIALTLWPGNHSLQAVFPGPSPPPWCASRHKADKMAYILSHKNGREGEETLSIHYIRLLFRRECASHTSYLYIYTQNKISQHQTKWFCEAHGHNT